MATILIIILLLLILGGGYGWHSGIYTGPGGNTMIGALVLVLIVILIVYLLLPFIGTRGLP